MASRGPLAAFRGWLPARRLLLAPVGTAVVGVLAVLAFDAGLVRIPAGTTRAAESVVAEYGLLALFGLFVVTRRAGRERVLRRDRFPVSADGLDRFDGWFERWGPLVVP